MKEASAGEKTLGIEILACGVNHGDLGDGLDATDIGAEIANDDESAAVRHAIEVAVLIVSDEAELIGLAEWRLRGLRVRDGGEQED